LKASSWGVGARVSYGNIGDVTVALDNVVRPYRTYLEFEFTLEHGEWKLSRVPMYEFRFPVELGAAR
jgi:hypothetical protein